MVIIDGHKSETILKHILEALQKDVQIQNYYEKKFTEVLSTYYNYDYKDSTGLITFDKLDLRVTILFTLTGIQSNIIDRTLEFNYNDVLMPGPIIKSSQHFDIEEDDHRRIISSHGIKAFPSDYSRRYFMDKEVISHIFSIILPKYVGKVILPTDIPKDSFWELDFDHL